MAAAAVGITAVFGYLFTAKSVRIEVEPPDASVAIADAVDLTLGGTWLLLEGDYEVDVRADGYTPLRAALRVNADDNQTHRFALVPLPGLIDFTSTPVAGADVRVDDSIIGQTPLYAAEVAAGKRTISITAPRYQPYSIELDVAGRHAQQSVAATLAPNWASVTVTTSPSGARVLVDEVDIGATPGTFELLAGTRELRLKLPAHKSDVRRLDVVAGEALTLPGVVLQPADALLTVRSNPTAVAVTVDGKYQGTTPIEVSLQPARAHRIRLSKSGYAPVERTVTLGATEERTLDLAMDALLGTVVIKADPADAEIVIDGQSRGTERTLRLPARAHRIEVRKRGYAAYSTVITPQPNITSELAVDLLTDAEARLAALVPRIVNPAGGQMVLLEGGVVEMGASRREPGRRANEVLRTATVTRLFYLGVTEVTNAQFRKFASGHNSGAFEEQDLNKDDQPASGMTWQEAALFCNWLSEQAKLPLFYRTEFGKVTGFNPRATGYRMPTEAEWTWAARTRPDGTATQRFPWGDSFPPPDRSGNYADRSAAHLLGRIIFGYSDNYIVAAPVATFPADLRGLHDLSGNVAEWMNDFYEIPSEAPVVDPMGPASADYHVIRGSSWMHGTITDLRTAFRDYGEDGRPDLGLRLARFAE